MTQKKALVVIDIQNDTPKNYSEEFTDFISKNEIREFYLTGADATICVKSTCYNLCKANYNVIVLSDCISIWDKKKIPKMLNYYEKNGNKIINLNDL